MTNNKDRAVIDLGLDDDPPNAPPSQTNVDPKTIKEVSRKSGFGETPRSAERDVSREIPRAEKPVLKRRRARKKTGRIHQFSTRIDFETNNMIYEYSEKYGITLGETLERAIKSLVRENNSN